MAQSSIIGGLSNQQVGILLSGAIAIGIFAYNYAFRGVDLTDAMLISVMAGFLGDRIGTSLDNQSALRSIKAEVESLRQATADAHDVVVFPTAADALPSLLTDLASATHVYNTNVGTDGSANSEAFAAAAYSEFARNPDAEVWFDLVGIKELHRARYRDLKLTGASPKFRQKVLRKNAVMVNFTIIKLKERHGIRGYEVAYFGWVADDGVKYVCLTHRRKSIDLLRAYARQLTTNYAWTTDDSHDAELVEEDARTILSPRTSFACVDKVGAWAAKVEEDGQTIGYRVFTVKFDDEHGEVRGIAYDQAMKPIGSFAYSGVSYERNRLLFDYKDSFSSGVVSGFSMLEFKPGVPADTLSGVAVMDNTNKTRRLEGARIAPDDTKSAEKGRKALSKIFQRPTSLAA